MRNRILILSALVLALAVFAMVPTSRANAYGGMVHCVMPGETLFRIAMMNGTSVMAIAQANGIVNPNYVRAGQCLVIPAAPMPMPSMQPHHSMMCGPGMVMPGDTLFAISRRTGVSPWAIAQANHLMNPNYIRAGQCLIIPRW